MTAELFNAITFRFISHASYSDEYISVYESANFTPTITIKVFTKKKNAFETTKRRREYHFMGEVYRSKESLINAINKFFNKQK